MRGLINRIFGQKSAKRGGIERGIVWGLGSSSSTPPSVASFDLKIIASLVASVLTNIPSGAGGGRFATLLNNPSERYALPDLIRELIYSIILTGKGFLSISRFGKEIVGLELFAQAPVIVPVDVGHVRKWYYEFGDEK